MNQAMREMNWLIAPGEISRKDQGAESNLSDMTKRSKLSHGAASMGMPGAVMPELDIEPVFEVGILEATEYAMIPLFKTLTSDIVINRALMLEIKAMKDTLHDNLGRFMVSLSFLASLNVLESFIRRDCISRTAWRDK